MMPFTYPQAVAFALGWKDGERSLGLITQANASRFLDLPDGLAFDTVTDRVGAYRLGFWSAQREHAQELVGIVPSSRIG